MRGGVVGRVERVDERAHRLELAQHLLVAAAVDELELGLAAIAAPVHGSGGGVIASLAISGPTMRMSPDRIDEIEPRLIEEAQTLSDRLSPTPEGEPIA